MALFQLLVDVAASTASFEAGMQRVEDRLSKLGNLVKGGLEIAGVTTTLAELGEQFSKTAEDAAKLDLLAQRLGTSVESLSQLKYAAEATDVPFQSLSVALDIMSRNMVQASENSGRAKKAFHDLGIDTAALAKIPLDQQLGVIADRISKLQSPAQQIAAAMRIFGNAGADLLPILRNGAQGIDDLRKKSDDLGATLSTEAVDNMKRAHDAMTDLTAASKGLWNELVADAAPAITALEKSLTNLAVGVRSVFGAFGQQKSGTSDVDQLTAIIRKIRDESDQLDKLNQITSARQRIGAQGMIQKAESTIASLSAELAALQTKIDAAKPKAPDVNVDIGPDLEEVRVRAQKTIPDYMQQMYDRLDKMSETSVEKEAADWQAREDAARELYKDGKISAEEFYARIAALNDEFLSPVEVSAKYIGKIIKTVYDDMDKYARSAADSVQQSFATFLEAPSINGFKRLLIAWIDTVEKMVAEAASAQLMKALFGDNTISGGLEGIFGSLLGGIFGGGAGSSAGVLTEVQSPGLLSLAGFANGGSFNVGGAGGTDSQLVAFKATPGEHVQVGGGGGGGGGDIYVTNNVSVTSPQVTQSDVVAAMKQTSDATIARIRDLKRKGSF